MIFYYTGTVYPSQNHAPETKPQQQSCSNLIPEHPVCGRGILSDSTGDTRDADEILSDIPESLTIISLTCGKQSEGPSDTVFSEESIVLDDEGFVPTSTYGFVPTSTHGFAHRTSSLNADIVHRICVGSQVPAIVVGGPSPSSATYQTKTSHVYGEGAVLLNPQDLKSMTHGYNTDENARGGSGPLALEPLQTPSIGYRILTKAIALSALRDPPPPRCASGTGRNMTNEIMERIMGWISNDEPPPILWLHGSAGYGKSALAETVVQRCYEDAGLTASFFFSRKTSDRNSDKHLVPTLAYQLAAKNPKTRPIVEKIVEGDPSIFSRAVNAQFAKLVIDPLLQVSKEADHRTVIILDGLDECDGYDKQRGILDAIYEATLRSHTLPFRFLVVSRPDPHIQDFFNHDNLREISRHIPLSNNNDVSTFLRTELGRIRKDRRLPTAWPIEKDIATLVKKASGPYIFASTVLRYIEDSRHYPPARLEAILGITTHKKSPFADLDALYRKILESTSDTKCTLRLFGLLLYVTDKKFASPSFIQHLLGLGPERFETLLHDVHPLIDVPVNLRDENPIQITHTSLMDFLTDHSRSGDYFLDPKVVHSDLTQMCFRVLSPGTVLEGHGAGASFLV